MFSQWIIGNEVIWGVLASQVISNVPAAILLSGFSTNYEAIIVGINIGGLGTLIASMANLISYKILAREFNDFKSRYLIVFTVLNIALLLILLAVYVLTNWFLKIEINYYFLGKFILKKVFKNRITVVIHIIDAETLLTVIKGW